MFVAMASIESDSVDRVLPPVEPSALRDGEGVRLVVVQSDPARWDMSRLASAPAEELALAEAGLGAWADALDDRLER